jgi:signal transduction histidine kinase
LHDEKGVADCSFQQGIVSYYTDKAFGKALNNFREAQAIYLKLDNRGRASAAEYLIGLCYFRLGDFQKAEQTLSQALKEKNELGDEQGYHECLGGLANVYLAQGRFTESQAMHEECLRFFVGENNPDGIAEANLGLGKVFRAKGDDRQAIQYFSKAYDGAKEAGYLPMVLATSQQLQELFDSGGDYRQAYHYLKEYYAARDSEFNADVARKIAALQYNLDLTVKQSEIDRLNQERRNDRILRFVMLAGIALFIFLAVLWYQRYRFKKRTNAELSRINHELNSALDTLKKTQSQLLLSEKLASVGQLTAGVAHEINNPVNFVTGNINPLKRNFETLKSLFQKISEVSSDGDARTALAEIEALKKEMDFDFTVKESEKLLSGIEEGSRRTAAIVKGLRQFSRMDEDTKKLASINEGIESTLLLLQNKLKYQSIEVILSLGNIPQIHCFPGQLNQVFMNLLTNAIDAIGTGGTIFITTAMAGDRLKISIRDSGQGMTEDVKKRIFDPFYTTKEVGKGTGLGLSISYGIIEKHHGTIEVKTEPGKGTEFIILLPL